MSDNYQNKENTGAIFKNNKKTSVKHPDYRGTVNVEGKEFEIALWLKESQKGTKYFSVALSEPYQTPQNITPAQEANQAPPPMDNSFEESNDDLPF